MSAPCFTDGPHTSSATFKLREVNSGALQLDVSEDRSPADAGAACDVHAHWQGMESPFVDGTEYQVSVDRSLVEGGIVVVKDQHDQLIAVDYGALPDRLTEATFLDDLGLDVSFKPLCTISTGCWEKETASAAIVTTSGGGDGATLITGQSAEFDADGVRYAFVFRGQRTHTGRRPLEVCQIMDGMFLEGLSFNVFALNQRTSAESKCGSSVGCVQLDAR
jgi:hypothetical protein